MNPLLATAEIQAFLESFPSAIRRRGKHYYQNGTVTELACLEPDRQYSAVVCGSAEYEVGFDYDPETHSWSAECTCPVGYECKHAYAAMLALRANAATISAPRPAAPAKRSGRKKAGPTTVTLREAPQPPTSSLSTRLRQALGRSLSHAEAEYVRRVQELYQQARNGYQMTPESLRCLAAGLQDYSWNPLVLWLDFPPDDLQFWLYCAWEFRRRALALPEFMQPVTDFAAIEPAMRAWERQKAIEHWRASLEDEGFSPEPEPESVDFRLLILPGAARIQWKSVGEEKFKDLKQTHLRRLTERYQAGLLDVVPDAIPLWAANSTFLPKTTKVWHGSA